MFSTVFAKTSMYKEWVLAFIAKVIGFWMIMIMQYRYRHMRLSIIQGSPITNALMQIVSNSQIVNLQDFLQDPVSPLDARQAID